tara:strand:- start:259 stop:438 length:180 start_codon:yes stop_codon:yes gene_type:complete
MLVRWGLAGHGAIHVVETFVNLYEQAWISASISALAGFLMIAGACIDYTHHHGGKDEGR